MSSFLGQLPPHPWREGFRTRFPRVNNTDLPVGVTRKYTNGLMVGYMVQWSDGGSRKTRVFTFHRHGILAKECAISFRKSMERRLLRKLGAYYSKQYNR